MRPAPAPADWAQADAEVANGAAESEEDLRIAASDLATPDLTPATFASMSKEDQWNAVAHFQSRVKNGASRTLARAEGSGSISLPPPSPPPHKTLYQSSHQQQSLYASAPPMMQQPAQYQQQQQQQPVGPPPLPPRGGGGTANGFIQNQSAVSGQSSQNTSHNLGVPDDEEIEAVHVDGPGNESWK